MAALTPLRGPDEPVLSDFLRVAAKASLDH
jgi:hypothetical protein